MQVSLLTRLHLHPKSLEIRPTSGYCCPMSAVELLEEAKKLPEAERELLIDALLQVEGNPQTQTQPPSQTVQWPDVLERAKKIFGDQVFENPILEERASRDF